MPCWMFGPNAVSFMSTSSGSGIATAFSMRTKRAGRFAAGVTTDVLDSVAPGIRKLVSHRQVLTPVDLERDYGLTGGHPLHAEAGLDQFFVWRPLLGHARYRLGLERLYLCGSGAHPGGGITGGPGQNAAREILSDLRRSRR